MTGINLRDRVWFGVFLVLLSVGIVSSVRGSIDSQNRILEEQQQAGTQAGLAFQKLVVQIRDASRAQVCVLALPPEERTAEAVHGCLVENHLLPEETP